MKVYVIGCGTSGNQVIPLLKGKITVIDRDLVEERNLVRQPLYKKADIGQPKAEVLADRLPVSGKVMDLDHTNVGILREADLVIDCTDNLSTRFLINEYCSKEKIPWIYTGVVGSMGRVLAFNGKYCFACFHKEVKGLDTCTTAGVDMAVAKKVGIIAANEANKLLNGLKPTGLWANGEWFNILANPSCNVCNEEYKYLDGKMDSIVKFCGSSRYQFKGNFNFENVKKRLDGKGDWFVYKDFYIFKDRVLVKADSEEEAKKKFTTIIGC